MRRAAEEQQGQGSRSIAAKLTPELKTLLEQSADIVQLATRERQDTEVVERARDVHGIVRCPRERQSFAE